MKKWGLLFLLCLGFAFINKALFFQEKVEIQNYDQNPKDHLDNRGTSESTQTKTITNEQIYQGNLLLFNSKYPVRQESVKSDIVNLSKHNELINGYGLLDTNIYMSKGIAQKFSEMVNDAVKEGVSHFIINSGYRDFDEQSVLYQEMGADYALPAGYSEHNSGLSLDVGSSLTKMERAPEGKWLKENAWKYGFILRYPKDKTDVTGIQYEPWHIRYVGFPHSAIMKEKNFALEEYMDFLKEEESISVSIDGQKYTISYYPISQNETIDVEIPVDEHYEISGNNIDGVIVTTRS
ncbi:VanY-A/VanY-F/VanY-M family D-Ala-D-Ala carboxypeptidase [Paenibacillus thiaminolyticus]|uniref:VanY-A/VanY-F/VanY-M family D-Ala-D-Ala carboxypeptidase n=1 Tax=Paenibacillus thiaminolyticus TaxID=49283 RepID=A0A3A3GGA2_PANTH|nr:VanY-A/VanY-F/VanY-M family D-Ala-D-Ala carboxypeptidase [Paenibacillus thiaminolyticus]RJG22170.1 VanY-A/VanY-F/VanY-M family D-Ala-D-Ala carboxypeptidase [Paenibacillus thiaminolyticus]